MFTKVKQKLQRITKFSPAYDKRNSDPKKNYGIHSVQCFMILKGKEGVVHFVFSTGMFLESTMNEYAAQGRLNPTPLGGKSDKWFRLNAPMGYDVGYHSSKPMYEDQSVSQKKCEWLDGKTCYCDGSGLRAVQFLDIFIEQGSDKIWELLEKEYAEVFGKKKVKKIKK